MTLIIRNACAALTAGTLLAIASSLSAQTPDQAPPAATTPVPQAESETSAAIADEKVEQFAAAFIEVQKIQAQATQQLTSTTDEQQATAVKASAEKKMIEAVEREGMQVEEFNQIADLITTDMSLRARVVEKVQRRAKG